MNRTQHLLTLLDQRTHIDMQIARIRRDMFGSACGTDSGYFHHRRQLNEAACAECKAAHATAERLRVSDKSVAA